MDVFVTVENTPIDVNVSHDITDISISNNGASSSIDTSQFLTTGGAYDTYYPRNNPSGYITSAQAGSVLSINSLSGVINLTGINNTIFQSGQYIFISGLSGSNSASISLGDYNIVYQTGNQIISGNKSFSGILAAGILSGLHSSNLIDVNNAKLKVGTGDKLRWDIGQVYDSNHNFSIDWQNKVLFNTEWPIVDWQNQYLTRYLGAIAMNWYLSYLYDSHGNYSIDWDNRQLYNPNDGTINLDWSNKILSGTWNVLGGIRTSGAALITGIDTGSFASIVNLQNSGQTLYNLLVNESGSLYNQIYNSGQNAYSNYTSLSGNVVNSGNNLYSYIINSSGAFDARLYQTGVNIISLINASAGGVSSLNNASGILSLTGKGNVTVISGGIGLIQISGDTGAYASFYPFVNPLQFSTSGNLQNTGINLQNSINLDSGNLTITGQTIYTSINSLSGWINNTSRISSISVTGFSAQTGTINISGLGTITTFTGVNNFIYISGSSASSFIDHGDGINISGDLTITGQTLDNKINSLSGYINSLTGNINIILGRENLISGDFNSQRISFTGTFDNIPIVFGAMVNNSGEPILPYQISGISRSGFYLNFGDVLNSNNYSFHYLATTGIGMFNMGGFGSTNNLLGGSSGTYLRKNSDTNNDYSWSKVLVGGYSTTGNANTIVPNADLGNIIDITNVTGTINISAPIGNITNGQSIQYRFHLANTGYLVWDNIYSFGSDIITGMIPTNSGTKFEVNTRFYNNDNKWRIIGLVRGF